MSRQIKDAILIVGYFSWILLMSRYFPPVMRWPDAIYTTVLCLVTFSLGRNWK